MRYAIIYLAVPLADEMDGEETSEEDAAAIGEIIHFSINRYAPVEGVELIGTRLTRNNLVAPGITRFPAP
jgi:hypothetical protein